MKRIQDAAARIVEARTGLRWHASRVLSPLYRAAFHQFGAGSVIVDPRSLKGVRAISIGDGCAIYGGAWLQAEGPTASIHVGDHVYLGHDVHLHSIDPIWIGDDCTCADGVFIATTDHVAGSPADVVGTGAVTIGSRVFIGQRACILGGVTIGDDVVVGAGAVVTRSVEAGTTVAGIPARPIGRRHGRHEESM